MELEYLNGVRTSKLYHEMTPLEAAIQRYEQQAKKHFSQQNKNLHLTKEVRATKLKESLAHLAGERRSLEAVNEAQTALEMYRKDGAKVVTGTDKERAGALTMMRSERHHPTALLEKLMRAEGTPKPSAKHTAHHILPGSGRFMQAQISRARLHMHVNGIRINDPANGVYLVSVDRDTPHWSMQNSRGHKKYHTKEYEAATASKVRAVSGMDQIKTQLQIIGRMPQDNEPKEAMPKIRGL